MPEALDSFSDRVKTLLEAPGCPGIPPRWTSSAKSGVGTALSALSRVWFTLSHGIVNEVYYPRVDHACIRDMGLIVTGAGGYVAEEKRVADTKLEQIRPGVAAFHLVNTSRDGRWRIEKRILCDPLRDTLLQETKFVPLVGKLEDYRLHVLLAPHLVNRGADNTGWLADYKGVPMLFASGSLASLALASSVPWRLRSAGFAGTSDGWADLMADGQLSHIYERAEGGNVALLGELDLHACGGSFVLALGFARVPFEAGFRALCSLNDGVESALAADIAAWETWQARLTPLDRPDGNNLYRVSTAVLKTHSAQTFPGGTIASLSIPWGFNKGDEDLGGYHLVWPRDLVETAGGFLAAGALEEARQVLTYLEATQEPGGGWPQNMWLDGTAYWTGVQMDECAFPILLVDLAHRMGALRPGDIERFWPMAQQAAGFILSHGPITGQDRWEEDGGFSPFTLAVEIAALVVAADLARAMGEDAAALLFEQTADAWNADIERWTFVTDGELVERLNIAGYYVRIAPPEGADAASPAAGFVPIKNRAPAEASAAAAAIVSPDALALVRFGLRAADDPRIRDTVAVIDALLKSELPQGPVWLRYNQDGYGEHEDGSPFDGTGVGRPWPLMTGERAHYALALGDHAEATRLRDTFEASAGPGGMLPEQVWDGDDIPERELFRGRPTGSAMPLVWAHGEYIKLLRSLRDRAVFDMPPQTVQRYQVDRVAPTHAIWAPQLKRRGISAGRVFRLQLPEAATVHWSADGWLSVTDTPTQDSGFGTHLADLPTETLPAGGEVVFTFRWSRDDRWEGVDYRVTIE